MLSLLARLTSPDLLSQGQLKRLKEHKYRAEGTTVLDAPMQVLWDWMLEHFVPKTVSPNTLTLIGVAVNILGATILMLFSPTATEPAPRWAYFTAAVTLFMYQALDALDGKQERRTHFKPIGDFLDHGCDSFSTVCIAVEFVIAIQLGTRPELLFVTVVLSFFMFYASQWQAYVSGTMHFGRFDVTESQLTLITIFSLSAFFGPEIWAFKVFGIELKVLVFLVGSFMAVVSVLNYIRIMFGGEGKGRDGSTVADTSVIAPALHIGLVILLAVIIKEKSDSGLYEAQPCVYLLTFGTVASKMTNKIIVAHMTKSPMDLLDSIFLGPGLLFLNQYFDTPVPENILLWITMIYCMADLARYVALVCQQISISYGVYCFDISRRRPKQATSIPPLK